jgi:hypothetical protein
MAVLQRVQEAGDAGQLSDSLITNAGDSPGGREGNMEGEEDVVVENPSENCEN